MAPEAAPPPNVFPESSYVGVADREQLLGQRGCVLWFSGLSGSGKSTIAKALEQRLVQGKHLTYVLDGDNIRRGLNRNLGFSIEDRDENLRRISEVSRLFSECGIICLTAFISPLRSARIRAKEIIGAERFLEVHISTDLGECEKRDVKGLYARARRGEVKDFTGITSPFEAPLDPAIRIDTGVCSLDDAVDQLEAMLVERGILSPSPTEG